MGRLGYINDTEFEITSDKIPALVLTQEPKNWDDDEKSYSYDKEGRGTLMKINTQLEFGKEVWSYLKGVIFAFGFGSTCEIIKRGKSTTKIGEDKRILYQAVLDVDKAEFDDSIKSVKVPFTQGGLYDVVKSRYNDTYDLVNTKSADNKDITAIDTVIEQVIGREIFRRTELNVEDGTITDIEFRGGGKDTARAVPFQIVRNSDSDSIGGINIGAEKVNFADNDYKDGNVGSLLYFDADESKRLRLNGRVKFEVTNDTSGFIYLQGIKYTLENGVLKFKTGSAEAFDYVSSSTVGNVLDYSFTNHFVDLEKGESYAIVLLARRNGSFIGLHTLKWEFSDTYMVVENDDSFKPTQAKVMLPYEYFDRLLEKITGEKGLLITNVFGRKELGYKEDGDWAYLGVSSGFWARGFDIGAEIINPETQEPYDKKQFNISLKDAVESFHTIFPLMWSIEVVNGKERFRLEKYEYTQQSFVGVRLGRTVNGAFQYIPAQKPKTTILSSDLFTGVKMGYEKGGNEYEEVSGLSSPHGMMERTTSLGSKRNESNIYTQLSKIRADLEGYDLARREQAVETYDIDTTYDQDIFFRHLKKTGTQYFLRTWEDDFNNAPSGKNVYSPGTMGNLLLTPFQCIKRHGKIIGTGLYTEPYGQLTFASSNCFSNFSMDDHVEDGAINNSELGKPFINGFKIGFEGKVYQEMIDEIEGFTEIDGERIPNWYGQYEVKIGDELVRGRIMDIKINKNGKHEIAQI